MISSKYLYKTFDHGWTCAAVGLANVQGKKAKRPGKRNYYYVFERRTSDGKADKILRLNSSEAASVYNGKAKVEDIAEKRLSKEEDSVARKVSYYFGD